MKEIRKIGCIGAGLIGRGWATVFSSGGYEVLLHDMNADVLGKAMGQIKSDLMFLETNELLNKGVAESALKRIDTTGDLAEAVDNADYIQESVFDNYELKKQVFKKVDELAPKSAILASSTSGLLMTEIQKAVAAPERCVLAHPYLPVHLMPLVEVVGGRQTSPAALTATCGLMEKIGKTPILLKREVSGFIVNRLQAALLREAIDLVDGGVASAEDVDKAFCLSAGLRGPLLGPLLRAHLAGNGIEQFFANYSQSYRVRWESMAAWHSIPSRAVDANIKSINEMEVVRTRSLNEIKSWRDDMLVKILKIIREGAISTRE